MRLRHGARRRCGRPCRIHHVSPTDTLELALVLLVAIAVLVEIARRLRVAYPIVLVIGGLTLGALPGLPPITLAPDLVLVVFLPPLLFYAAYDTPIRDLRANIAPITLLAVGLVLATTVVVAAITKLFLPGLPWAAAVALGAIVSPPDALAATTIFRSLPVPRQIATVLEGESLLNDATALVGYRTALVALIGGVTLVGSMTDLLIVALGGLAVGLAAGQLSVGLYRLLDDPPVEVAISLAVPYAAYLPAEQLGVSGVIAAVIAGLILGRHSARILSPDTRVLGRDVWEIVAFVLNGFAFLLIGFQLPDILGRMDGDIAPAIALAGAVGLGVVLVRFAWVFGWAWLRPGLFGRMLSATDGEPWRKLLVVAWGGMRGVVSLAAALALPPEFPQRGLILFVTVVVIVMTLVGQGLTFGPLVARLGITGDRESAMEERRAREAAIAAGLRAIEAMRSQWPEHLPLLDRLAAGYLDRLRHLPQDELRPADPARDREMQEHQAIRLTALAAEREAVIALRDALIIGDDVMRRVERELDLEELRLEA